jgi:GH15 family glucan-1,4-alpha-glucosidase
MNEPFDKTVHSIKESINSKIMCWVALDRAIALADLLDASDRAPHWKEVRTRIEVAVLNEGWNESIGAFTQTFENEALDASNLMIPIVGFLPAEIPGSFRPSK